MISTEGKTIQQVSDEIAAALIKQGKPCLRNYGCAYGDNLGNHCAVGWLLPKDSEFMYSTENVNELARKKNYLGKNTDFIKNNTQFLSLIQKLHDGGATRTRLRIAGDLEDSFGIDTTAWQPWIDLLKE